MPISRRGYFAVHVHRRGCAPASSAHGPGSQSSPSASNTRIVLEMSFALSDTALREQCIEQHLMYGPIEWCELQPRFETVGFLDELIGTETRHDLP